MLPKPTFDHVPPNSVLGLSFSGMHDSAIAITGPDGTPVFAVSLERLTRIKQDGRWPAEILGQMPWDKISAIAISTQKEMPKHYEVKSKLHPVPIPQPRKFGPEHGPEFHAFLAQLPQNIPLHFVDHHTAHAHSAFWASGYDRAICLTYDGGMSNSPWFGGLFSCSRDDGAVNMLDGFAFTHYAKITTLYSAVTAILGFSPNKHEGKVTGLAAHGKFQAKCRDIMMGWMMDQPEKLEAIVEWWGVYETENPPELVVRQFVRDAFKNELSEFSVPDIAATVQQLAEHHIEIILKQVRMAGYLQPNICLAGGLFANVKINQRVREFGFDGTFVVPPMTDDGTALGAAWAVQSAAGIRPGKILHMYLGPGYSPNETEDLLRKQKLNFTQLSDAPQQIAKLLSENKIVAVYQGRMEYGPRALGNRSILARTNDASVNDRLNKQLLRTEFMPFAPISRIETAADCYLDLKGAEHTAQFMTITTRCAPDFVRRCPAVVHVDRTARPQLVDQNISPLLHAILSEFEKQTGEPALVNTSLNIHEEPIVCSPQDAINGFLEAGLDYLYLDGYLLCYAENHEAALSRLREKRGQKALQHQSAMRQLHTLWQRYGRHEESINQKEYVIQLMATQAAGTGVSDVADQLIEKEKEIQRLKRTVTLFEAAVPVLKPLMRGLHVIRKYTPYPLIKALCILKFWLTPKLGRLSQHSPVPLRAPSDFRSARNKLPAITIVTPSYGQAEFIERTIESVLNQNYPNLEYIVQDGGSADGTVDILNKYAHRLTRWESVKDNGQAHAVNLGFRNTDGEIMAWLNSDDVLLPGALHRVGEFFAKHPDVDVVYGNRIVIDPADMEIGRWVLPGHDGKVLQWADFVPQETLFWRRRIWEKVGGVDESFKFALDWDLLLRFQVAGAKFAHFPEFLGAFRVHDAQKTMAWMANEGQCEMSLLRERVHGRPIHPMEVRKNVVSYILRHLWADIWLQFTNKMTRVLS